MMTCDTCKHKGQCVSEEHVVSNVCEDWAPGFVEGVDVDMESKKSEFTLWVSELTVEELMMMHDVVAQILAQRPAGGTL